MRHTRNPHMKYAVGLVVEYFYNSFGDEHLPTSIKGVIISWECIHKDGSREGNSIVDYTILTPMDAVPQYQQVGYI